MPETCYCYCCRVHHPVEQMRRYPTRVGDRWRCLRSIAAAHCSQSERDAVGRQQTRINREQAQRLAEYGQHLRRNRDQPGG